MLHVRYPSDVKNVVVLFHNTHSSISASLSVFEIGNIGKNTELNSMYRFIFQIVNFSLFGIHATSLYMYLPGKFPLEHSQILVPLTILPKLLLSPDLAGTDLVCLMCVRVCICVSVRNNWMGATLWTP